MKKIQKSILLALVALTFTFSSFVSCKTHSDPEDNNSDQNSSETDDKKSDDDSDSDESTDESSTVILIDGSKLKSDTWAFATINISDFKNKTVTASISSKVKVVSTASSSSSLNFQINTGSAYPIITNKSFAAGTSDYVDVTGSKSSIECGASPVFYISTYGLTVSEYKIYLKDFKLTVTDGTTTKEYTTFDSSDAISTENDKTSSDSKEDEKDETEDDTSITRDNKNWLSSDVPSLYDTYKDQFDYIGIAAEYGNFEIKQTGSNKYTATYTRENWGNPSELYYEEIQNGIKKHANSITLGNELKPQFLLQWWSGDGSSQTMVNFTGSNGKTIQVPDSLKGEKLIYATLNVCKAMNVKMRGHVLTWHSQTPDGFFAEGYKPEYNGDLITNLVDAETMTARHEWYIKTVLECVANWEEANNYQAIWAWDVVNESMADDAGKTYSGSSQNWLRGSTEGTKNKAPSNGGSRWYQVYGNEEFIVNAFRFANAYAPSSVKLCYNDYNEYWDAEGHYKTSAIEHIVSIVKAGESQTVNGKSVSPRIDVIAMQSHVGTSWPGVTGYEAALKRFLALADVHVSEIDFSAETQAAAATAYKQYFTMLQKYGKKSSGTHKVTNVTIWGINDENSWINPASAGGKKTYPLLFNIQDNVTTTKKSVTYDTGAVDLPVYDVGDTYKTNDSFWAVIEAHAN